LIIWLILLGAIALLTFRAYRNTFDVHIKDVAISLQKSSRMPAPHELDPVSVLHLSDLHMENLSIHPERIVADFSARQVDLIAITGDLLDREYNIPKAVSFVERLLQLKPALGVFVVFGNHDYVLSPLKLGQLKSELERIGCRVLVNQNETVYHNGQPLHIIGVDDFCTGHSQLDKAFSGVPATGARLVFTHDPNVVLHMNDYSYDYLLSGHFHGGQIHWPRPFHLATMGRLPKLNIIKGLHEMNGRPFYISEGLGQTGLNIRLRSRPEVTLHRIGVDEREQNPSLGMATYAPVLQETAATLVLD
jgi:uncharacterized protein